MGSHTDTERQSDTPTGTHTPSLIDGFPLLLTLYWARTWQPKRLSLSPSTGTPATWPGSAWSLWDSRDWGSPPDTLVTATLSTTAKPPPAWTQRRDQCQPCRVHSANPALWTNQRKLRRQTTQLRLSIHMRNEHVAISSQGILTTKRGTLASHPLTWWPGDHRTLYSEHLSHPWHTRQPHCDHLEEPNTHIS